MTREQIKNACIDAGVEAPTNVLITSILNAFKDEREAIKKDVEAAIRAEYKDYHSNDDYLKLQTELKTLKEAETLRAKAQSYNSIVKEAGYEMSDKWLNYMMREIGDVKDDELAGKIKDFIKENQEICKKIETTQKADENAAAKPVAKEKPVETEILKSFGDTKSAKAGDVKQAENLHDAIAEYYK